jgi:hypothetical protein
LVTSNQTNKNSRLVVCPESTIDSAPRRSFVKNAALFVAGRASSVVPGQQRPPRTSKPSLGCVVVACNVVAGYAVAADTCGHNSGGMSPGVKFGIGGEGISSNRTSAGNCRFDLSFWTDYNRRMVIRHNGTVGIGVACESFCSTLKVAGCIQAYKNIQGVCNGKGTGGIFGAASCGTGVLAESTCSSALRAHSCCNTALIGKTNNTLVGIFENVGVTRDLSSLIEIQNGYCSFSGCKNTQIWHVGVAGCNNASGVPNGDFYIEQCGPGVRAIIDTNGSLYDDANASNKGALRPGLVFGGTGSGEGISSNRFSCNPNQHGLDFYTDSPPSNPIGPRVSISNSGNVGVGTRTPTLNLQIAGSFGAKLATVTSNYVMAANDFGILANAAAGPLAVGLPAASTTAGMIVFIEKSDPSKNVVTVFAYSGDTIESKAEYALSTEYDGLTLVSDGNVHWYKMASET